MACALLHAAAIWVWHAPAPYMAAVFNTGWHVLEHASFVFTACLFWWSVLRAGQADSLRALLALLFTLMHTGLLGAVLTFAHTPLYWRESRELWDQQLAGLIMWIPCGTAYMAAAAWVVWRALARDGGAAAPAGRRAQVQGLPPRSS
jgi:putative membrane protein